jgi:hypothetical protein
MICGHSIGLGARGKGLGLPEVLRVFKVLEVLRVLEVR